MIDSELGLLYRYYVLHSGSVCVLLDRWWVLEDGGV